MSHLTTFKNEALKNTNKEMLKKSIEEIDGLTLDFNRKTVVNTWINESVDAGINYNGKEIAVGLRFSTDDNGDEVCTVAGDFYGTGLRQEDLTNKIAQVYTKNNIIDKCSQANWYLEEGSLTTDEEGNIVMEFFQYA